MKPLSLPYVKIFLAHIKLFSGLFQEDIAKTWEGNRLNNGLQQHLAFARRWSKCGHLSYWHSVTVQILQRYRGILHKIIVPILHFHCLFIFGYHWDFTEFRPWPSVPQRGFCLIPAITVLAIYISTLLGYGAIEISWIWGIIITHIGAHCSNRCAPSVNISWGYWLGRLQVLLYFVIILIGDQLVKIVGFMSQPRATPYILTFHPLSTCSIGHTRPILVKRGWIIPKSLHHHLLLPDSEFQWRYSPRSYSYLCGSPTAPLLLFHVVVDLPVVAEVIV